MGAWSHPKADAASPEDEGPRTLSAEAETPHADEPTPGFEPVPLRASELDPWLGQTLSERYRLERLVGKGGMGRVYRATQVPLNRPVAIKILNPEFQKKDPQFVRRFYLEAASAARLTHPHTITVFDYGETEDGQLFIVMEYLRGRPLSKALSQDGPFSALRTLHVATQVCRALREAHSKGIIHRDLKPGNILLLTEGDDTDFVKVLDFGLVKLFVPPRSADARDRRPTSDPASLADEEGELTRSGMFLGSPKYMSPEQIQGHPLDPRTDIYSLGVLMFQMLTGRPPFTGASSVEVIYRHVNDPVPSLAAFGIEAPPELEQLVLRCMAKTPDARYPSMADLLLRLKDVRRQLTGGGVVSESGVSYDSLAVSFADRPAAFAPSGPGSESGSRLEAVPVVGASGRPWLWASALLGTALVAGAAAAVWRATSSEASAPPPSAQGGAPESVRTALEPEPAIIRAAVRVESEPAGAKVYVDGEASGTTPLVLHLPVSARLRQFVFRRPGFQEHVEEVLVTEGGAQVSAVLEVDSTPSPSIDEVPNDYKNNPY